MSRFYRNSGGGLFTGLIVACVWFALVAVIAWGWISNLIHVINMTITPVTGEVIVRIIGIFVAPIGVLMGLFW